MPKKIDPEQYIKNEKLVIPLGDSIERAAREVRARGKRSEFAQQRKEVFSIVEQDVLPREIDKHTKFARMKLKNILRRKSIKSIDGPEHTKITIIRIMLSVIAEKVADEIWANFHNGETIEQSFEEARRHTDGTIAEKINDRYESLYKKAKKLFGIIGDE